MRARRSVAPSQVPGPRWSEAWGRRPWCRPALRCPGLRLPSSRLWRSPRLPHIWRRKRNKIEKTTLILAGGGGGPTWDSTWGPGRPCSRPWERRGRSPARRLRPSGRGPARVSPPRPAGSCTAGRRGWREPAVGPGWSTSRLSAGHYIRYQNTLLAWLDLWPAAPP